MSSISDFFTQSSSSSTTVTLPRVTHGTTCQKYTVGCCSSCCTCIPSSATEWAYEMFGQGAGGAGACCCMYAPWGGRGGHYAAARLSPGSSSLGLCYCACSCWCCSPAATGHCGQISRICSCGSLGSTAWCAMAGGGCCYGCTCCNYACSYVCPCRMDQAVSTHIDSGLPCGGVTAASDDATKGLQEMLNTVHNSNADGGVNEGSYFSDSFIGTLSLGGGGATAPKIGGTDLCNAADSIFSKQSEGCFCHPGNDKSHGFKCNVTESFSFDGSEGWSTGSMVCFKAICGHLGVGGAAYAGGANQTCVNLGSNDYWIGCMGLFPGGGGHSSGMCPGSCCCGSIGGAGVVAISYDN